jgi:NADPH:quinone reductase-like Zn-dependent oxidoreductase
VRAVVFDRPGDPSALRVADVPDPGPPTADRILVRVAASSVNGTDLGLRRGAPGAAVFGRRIRLGFDVVGEVVACGPTVTAFAPGDRVAALLPPSGGGCAQLVTLRQRRAALVPPEVTTVEAAALPLAGRAVPVTRAPVATASCTANDPIPPAAPCRWTGCSRWTGSPTPTATRRATRSAGRSSSP